MMRRLVQSLVALLVLAFASVAVARTEPIELASEGTDFIVDAADGMGRFATEASEVVASEWPSVAAASGAPSGATIRVHIEHAFDDWFEREDVPSRPPEWAAGLAIPSRRVILLAPGNPEWEATLEHEMAHVAVALATGDRSVPRWFNEGFALYTAEQWSMERASLMIQAGISGGFVDMDELAERYPSTGAAVDLAYAQSFHVVRWMRQTYGEDVWRDVMTTMRTDDVSFQRAFVTVTETPLSTALEAWESAARTRYTWAPIGVGGGAAWGVAMVLALMAWRRRSKSRRERLAEMSATESELFSPDPDDRTFGR